MIDNMRPKESAAKQAARPAPQPSEVRDLGEYRSVAPDGTVEVVKKRLVVYDSPVPCNNEANRALAEERRKHRDPAPDKETGFFRANPPPANDKERIRRDLEEQIAKKREAQARAKAQDEALSQAVVEQSVKAERTSREAELRRAAYLRTEARRALETSASRARTTLTDPTATSLNIGDNGAAAARTRELNRSTAEALRRELDAKQRRMDEERRGKHRSAVEEAQRAKEATMAHREEERRAKLAAQQKASDDLERSRESFRRQREAELQRDKASSAMIVAAAVGEHDARQRREEEHKRQQRALLAERTRQELEAKQAANARKAPTSVVTREETTVMMRCPKSGKLLPPTEFNIPRRQ